MRTLCRKVGMGGALSFVASLITFTAISASAQVNSWINAMSGDWQDAASWSLGIPPGSAQSIMITNASYKAVVIQSSTVSTAPQSLAVNSVTITSASSNLVNTFNTLLLNYAGAGNPLVLGIDSNTPGSLLVGTNSAVAMFSSGLIVNNALGVDNSRLGEFEVDGTFSQSDGSEVVAGFLDLNGTYNFTNGMVFIGTQFINGTFNQDGGTNLGAVVESTNGDYELFDGVFNGDITLSPGVFHQRGGTVSAQLSFGEPSSAGLYQLTGGMLLPGDLNMGAAPVTNFDVLPRGFIEQSGGTNNPTSFTIGFGSYSLSSNGVVIAPTMTLTTNTWAGGLYAGDFEQNGGYVTNGGIVMIGGTNVDNHNIVTRIAAKYDLNPGILITPSISMDVGDFDHYEGTNIVGNLVMSGSIYNMQGGGTLDADEIQLTGGSQFWHTSGTLGGMLNITLGNGTWSESTSGVQLGWLQVSSGSSFLVLNHSPSVVQFANSSGITWGAGDGILTIQGWNGSLSGGGAQQVIFGTSGSGLTAQQLGQVQFSNPAGLPNGTYSAQILSDGEVVPNPASSSSGPVNSWTKPTSGNWDDATSWSLGVLPNSSQTVLIANPGWKAVAINPSTPVNFPGSMTVSNLLIEGATNTENTLLLNYFGTAVPLTVLNGLTLQNGGQILNFSSGLDVQGGTFMITNSDMIQDGGFVSATNGPVYLSESEYDISNGVFQAGSVSLGYPIASHLNQYGGLVTIANLGLASYVTGTNDNVNRISLYGGTLNLPGGMNLYGEYSGLSYFQAGGTNYTAGVTIGVDYGGSIPSFTLNGGLLADNNMHLGAGDYGDLPVYQNGGSHVITNGLFIAGGNHLGEQEVPASYNLNGGTLSAGSIELDADDGDTLFNQTNGTVNAGTVYAHSLGYYSQNNTTITLAGGSLSCSNLTVDDGRGILIQSGGTLVVSNLLSVGGDRDYAPPYTSSYFGTYSITGGTVTARDVNISGIFNIGDSTTNRISNPGTFTLSHLLQINNASEQLGHFVLAGTNATINLAGGASQLSFANSSGQAWAASATLTVLNWNGNPSGGGAEQLKFGTDQTGLTAGQLSQIQFAIGTNTYSAKILATGEVVPNQAVGPSVAFSTQGNNFVVTWPTGWTLQSATNIPGPYNDVQGANSPYTNDMTLNPQRFFRLRQ